MHITITFYSRSGPEARRVVPVDEVGAAVQRLINWGTNPASLEEGRGMLLTFAKATDEEINEQAIHLATTGAEE